MDCKFGKIIDRKADDLDVINNKLADLGRVSSIIITQYIFLEFL